ncbi:MAG: PfkB family carbohydrate kinase [Candidatus Competibacteraceae bacterium]
MQGEFMRAFVLGNYMNANFLYVDRLPLAGESLAATRIFQEHGGKGLNLAVGLHRLGVTVDLLMAVGADEAGAAVKRRLDEEGMDTTRVLTLGPNSGYGVGFIAPDGRNFLAIHLGANALLTAEHVDQARDVFVHADWLVAQFEIPDPVILHAFRQARRLGKHTYLNPSPWRQIDNELLALTDVLVVNANEAALMFDQLDLEKLTPQGLVGATAQVGPTVRLDRSVAGRHPGRSGLRGARRCGPSRKPTRLPHPADRCHRRG